VLLDVVEALVAPLSATLAPLVPLPLIVPLMLYVFSDAVNETPVTFALLTVTALLVGAIVYPVLLGVTVYAPFASPPKLKFPEPSAVVDALDVPLNATLAPAPPLIVPVIE
jgi:hypothetical protein